MVLMLFPSRIISSEQGISAIAKREEFILPYLLGLCAHEPSWTSLTKSPFLLSLLSFVFFFYLQSLIAICILLKLFVNIYRIWMEILFCLCLYPFHLELGLCKLQFAGWMQSIAFLCSESGWMVLHFLVVLPGSIQGDL